MPTNLLFHLGLFWLIFNEILLLWLFHLPVAHSRNLEETDAPAD